MYEKTPFRQRLSRVSVWAVGHVRLMALFVIPIVLALTLDLPLGGKTVLILISLLSFLIMVYEYKTLFPEVAEAGHHPEKAKETRAE